jgi:hypothetical protein
MTGTISDAPETFGLITGSTKFAVFGAIHVVLVPAAASISADHAVDVDIIAAAIRAAAVTQPAVRNGTVVAHRIDRAGIAADVNRAVVAVVAVEVVEACDHIAGISVLVACFVNRTGIPGGNTGIQVFITDLRAIAED